MPEVAWESRGLECLLSPGCYSHLLGALLPGTRDRVTAPQRAGPEVGTAGQQEPSNIAASPGFDPATPSSNRALLTPERQVRTCRQGATVGSVQRGRPACPVGQCSDPSPWDSVDTRNHVPIREASDSPQRTPEGASPVSWSPWPAGPQRAPVGSKFFPGLGQITKQINPDSWSHTVTSRGPGGAKGATME